MWFPQAATAMIPHVYTTVSAATAGTSTDYPIGTRTPMTGDLMGIIVTAPSGTGAITAALVNTAIGFTVPRKVYDSTDTDPRIRVAVFTSYGTNANNAASFTWRVTHPTGGLIGTGWYTRGVPDINPTVVAKTTTGDDFLDITTSSPAFMLGVIGAPLTNLFTTGLKINPAPGFSNSHQFLGETGNVNQYSSRYSYQNTTSNTGHYLQPGQINAAGTARWRTNVPAAYNGATFRVLLAWADPSIRFGQNTQDASLVLTSTAFAAFGIPL